jgi:hypothetical protein
MFQLAPEEHEALKCQTGISIVGGKWLCVVVKYAESDAFVVTAYLTDKPKSGEDLWPIK